MVHLTDVNRAATRTNFNTFIFNPDHIDNKSRYYSPRMALHYRGTISKAKYRDSGAVT